jgi:hypothetical protein
MGQMDRGIQEYNMYRPSVTDEIPHHCDREN